MRSRVQPTAPVKMSPLFGPFSFSSIGRPSVMLPAVLAARRPLAPASNEVAALLAFGGLLLAAPAFPDNGGLVCNCFLTLSSSRRCWGTKCDRSWMRSLMLSRRRLSTWLCESRRRLFLSSTFCVPLVPCPCPTLGGKEACCADFRTSEMPLGWEPWPGADIGDSRNFEFEP